MTQHTRPRLFFNSRSSWSGLCALCSISPFFPFWAQLEINNSVYLFLMRFLDEFSRLNALIDDGNELPQGFTFIAINDIDISLFAEPHMLPGVSGKCAADQSATRCKEPFQHVYAESWRKKARFGAPATWLPPCGCARHGMRGGLRPSRCVARGR